MTVIANALSRAFQSAAAFDALRQIGFCCGACLLVFLLSLTYGLDLSPGFF